MKRLSPLAFFIPSILSIQSSTAAVIVSGETYEPSPRPVLLPSPYHPRVPFPSEPRSSTPPRRSGKMCIVNTHGDGVTDDSFSILFALWDCNDGGHVLFPRGETYTIGMAMDLTFLRSIDIDIQGLIQFTNDTEYWQANSFRFDFQNVTSFFKLGGEDVWIYGGGTINGNGEAWYDLYARDVHTLRPVLIGIDGLKDSVISDLNVIDSPQDFHFVANSTDLVFNNITIDGGKSRSENKACNCDGWDLYRSQDITIMNSIARNIDDCVSLKPNSTNILIQSIHCSSSHGISIGPLGQHPSEFDIVSSVHIANITFINSTGGASIQAWPEISPTLSPDLQGGGGSGLIRNITFEDITISNVDYAIEITHCYGQKNLTMCQMFPSKVRIEDVTFRRFKGRTSEKFEPLVAALACAGTASCGNITAREIDVLSPKGKRQAYCLNVKEGELDVECTDTFREWS
ncbi:exopolygalacturonase [Naviculisporaceae sp. PSN 640]